MELLYNLTNKNKSVTISLQLSEIISDIHTKANDWFKYVYIENHQHEVEFEASKLRSDIAYLLSKAIWLIDITKDLGLDINRNIQAIKELYKTYNNADKSPFIVLGKCFVTEQTYNTSEERLYTDKELKTQHEKMIQLLNDLDLN